MIQTELRLPLSYTDADIERALRAHLPIGEAPIGEIKKIRRAMKGGGEEGHYYMLRVAVSLSEEREAGLLKMKKKVSPYEPPALSIPRIKAEKPPVVVGMGIRYSRVLRKSYSVTLNCSVLNLEF